MIDSEFQLPQRFDDEKDELSYQEILECIGDSLVGKSAEPSMKELQDYMYYTNEIYKISGIQHIVLVCVIFVTIGVHIFRKNKYTCFQWSSLAMLVA